MQSATMDPNLLLKNLQDLHKLRISSMSPAVQAIHNQMDCLEKKKPVQTIKNIFKRAKAEGGNDLLSILEYRTTPVDGLASPAQVLRGRQLRSVLPTTSKHLEPKTINPDQVTANTFKPHKRTTMTGPATINHLSEPATTYM